MNMSMHISDFVYGAIDSICNRFGLVVRSCPCSATGQTHDGAVELFLD